MVLESVQQVTTNGNALAITIPKKISEIMNIELGDYIRINWGEIIMKAKDRKNVRKAKKFKKEELPTI